MEIVAAIINSVSNVIVALISLITATISAGEMIKSDQKKDSSKRDNNTVIMPSKILKIIIICNVFIGLIFIIVALFNFLRADALKKRNAVWNDLPDGVVIYNWNRHWYWISDSAMTWNEAREYCEKLGGYLAEITTQEEQTFLSDKLKNGGKGSYWLGGSDENQESKWIWGNGDVISYNNWYSAQPDNARDEEHYLMIYNYVDEKFHGFWNDIGERGGTGYYALTNFGFICEWDSLQKTFTD